MKKKEQRRRKKCQQAARQSADDPPPLRPSKLIHHRPRLRPAAYQAAPPARDATSTTLLPGRVLGFPPARERKWGMDTSDTLQEGMVATSAVTASEPEESRQGISPALQAPPPNQAEANQPPRRPPACATAVLTPPTPPHRDHHHEAKRMERDARGDRSSSTGATRKGTTSTTVVREARVSGTVAVAVQTQQQGIPGHPWPG